jgi:hypothetical protein
MARIAPSRGLSSSFRRHVPLDLNKSYPWGKPCDVFPQPKGPHITEEHAKELRSLWKKLSRQVVPGLVSQDISGVQPMSEPTGLIFSFRPQYTPVIDRIVMPDGRILNRNTDYTPSDNASLHFNTTSNV